MTSLSDVYEGGVGTATNPRRRLLGAGLFAVGAAMVVGAIPVATTDLPARVGLGVYEARELAGVLAGLGLPAIFVGIFAVLPAGRVTRAAAAIGASVAVLGVAVFAAAYPYNWISSNPTLAVATTVIYSGGTLVTFWCLFVGLATFKRRNDPGGSARIEITDEGTLRVVADETSRVPDFGSVGLFGGDPDGEVDTQTSNPTSGGDTIVAEPDTGSATPGGSNTGTPASDGAGGVRSSGSRSGTDREPAGGPDPESALDRRGRPDEYCGNCRHFEYVRADGDLVPYCGFHDDLLGDMDACEQWEPDGRTHGV
jgi:hypothetical protein